MTKKMNLDQQSISLSITGYYCNDWPNVKIFLNDNVLYDGKVLNQKRFVFTNIEFKETNTLIIEHYGKRFGEDNIWDTEVGENNNIINDRHFTVNDILVNDISLKEVWHHGSFSDYEIIQEHVDKLFFNFNMSYTFNFETPFYNWLIDKKREGYLEIGPTWKKSALNSLPDGYSISLLKIESLFDDIEEVIKKL